jgi:hypothetical protein
LPGTASASVCASWAAPWKRFRSARGEKRTKLTANGGGRDAKGCLFDSYAIRPRTVRALIMLLAAYDKVRINGLLRSKSIT